MLDPKLKEAINAAVKTAGQPPELAVTLNAWLEAVVDGNEELTDRDATNRRVHLLYEKTNAKL